MTDLSIGRDQPSSISLNLGHDRSPKRDWDKLVRCSVELPRFPCNPNRPVWLKDNSKAVVIVDRASDMSAHCRMPTLARNPARWTIWIWRAWSEGDSACCSTIYTRKALARTMPVDNMLEPTGAQLKASRLPVLVQTTRFTPHIVHNRVLSALSEGSLHSLQELPAGFIA